MNLILKEDDLKNNHLQLVYFNFKCSIDKGEDNSFLIIIDSYTIKNKYFEKSTFRSTSLKSAIDFVNNNLKVYDSILHPCF